MVLLDSEERKKKIEAAFAGREPLDERTFYELYFINRGIPADVVGRFRRGRTKTELSGAPSPSAGRSR